MRARFTTDEIAAAELGIVDTSGLNALSMRSLAAALGTGPMTVYNYVADKEGLEELVADFSGTVLLVSHDRVFLDRVVTSTLAFEGNGRVVEYVGGYDDYLRQRPAVVAVESRLRATEISPQKRSRPRRLSYSEGRELETLPDRIAAQSPAAVAALAIQQRLQRMAAAARPRATPPPHSRAHQAPTM